MRKRSCIMLLIVAGIVALLAAPILLLMSNDGPYKEDDCERAVRLGTFENIVAEFGSPLTNESEPGTWPAWKTWSGDVNDLWVEFDSTGQAWGALLQPRRPLLIHRILYR